MRTLIVVIFTVIVVWILFGGKDSIQKTLQVGNDFKQAIAKFNNKKENALTEIKEKITPVINKMKSKEKSYDVSELGKDVKLWSNNWRDICLDVDILIEEYETLGDEASEFFEELAERDSKIIINKELKNENFIQNKKILAEWSTEYEKAGVVINQVKLVVAEGQEYEHYFVSSIIRNDISKNIIALHKICEKAEALLERLSPLVATGLNIFEKQKVNKKNQP